MSPNKIYLTPATVIEKNPEYCILSLYNQKGICGYKNVNNLDLSVGTHLFIEEAIFFDNCTVRYFPVERKGLEKYFYFGKKPKDRFSKFKDSSFFKGD